MSRGSSAGADSLLREALRPSLLLCLALSFSALISYCGSHSSLLRAAVVCASLFAAALFLCCRRDTVRKSLLTALLYILICTAASGMLFLRSRSLQQECSFKNCSAVTAVIEQRTPYRYKDRLILTLSPADGKTISDRAVSWIPKESPLNEGDNIALSAEPEKISSSEDLFRQGVHLSLRITDNWSFIRQAKVPLRTKIRNSLVALNDRLYEGKSAGVINALMLGDSFFADKRITYDFTRAGVLHILAASGTHVVIVAAIPLFLFSLLRLPRSAAYTATSVILAAYYYLTCMPVSLLRACVMFWIITLCILLKKKEDTLNALYLSAAVILLIYPYDLFSLGFQLSYGATFGVILFQRRFRRSLPKLPFKISDSLAMTLSAQVAVLPILCVTVRELNFTGLISNIFLVPGTGLAFLGSIIADCTALIFPSAGAAAALCIDRFLQLNLAAAHYLALLPGHFPAPDTPLWLLVPYAALCLPLLFRKLSPAVAGSLIAFSLIFTFLPLRMTTAVQPQQISILEKKSRRILMIDGDKALVYGGIRSGDERNRIKSLLGNRGYCTPSLYISDFSCDSLRETASFIRTMPVETVIIAGDMPLDRRSLPILEALDHDGIIPVFERGSSLKNDCQYAAPVYQMKNICESALNVPDNSKS